MDSGQGLSISLLAFDFHAAKYLNALGLRAAGTVQRFRQITYCIAAARIDGSIDAFWSSGAVCGPNVATTLRDLVETARRTGDWARVRGLNAQMGATAGPLFPHGSFKTFSMYNIALEKARMDAAGWMKAGPVRPPYHLAPEPYLEGARMSGRMWASLSRALEQYGAP